MNYETVSMLEIAENYGFRVPRVSRRKQDPRGPEYGYFELELLAPVWADGKYTKNVVRVFKYGPDGARKWCCTFATNTDFANWAADTL